MRHLHYLDVIITSFNCSQVVVDVVKTFDEVHEYANDLFEVGCHKVEQHLAVFATRIKKDCSIRFFTDRVNHFVCMVYRCHINQSPCQMRRECRVLDLRDSLRGRLLYDNELG